MQQLQALILVPLALMTIPVAQARQEKLVGRVRLEGSSFVVVGEGPQGLPRRIRVKPKDSQGFELMELQGQTLQAVFEVKDTKKDQDAEGELVSYIPTAN
jgi:hypothetical protein